MITINNFKWNFADKVDDLAAVKQNGYALQYVIKQSPEICLAACQQNPEAREFITDAALRAQIELVFDMNLQEEIQDPTVRAQIELLLV